ncbi:class I SAM-dependent methyltransferase [Roseitalea porphyridii]|uniref:Methyltransferase domain-containing protein n=1 Tax=Roseitalea porphyridii TaxID=1852022 RepID=A0A4V1A3I3_9HYPH|nr:methyltransferase domain-containing protein [Roseitalea porphyridii]QBK29218.1 methyltransferase domain-containing protein [Roseitalea porphyridii]
MHTDIVELRAFYHSALGQRARRAIGLALSRIWKPLPNERLVGLGHARPWLDRFEPDTERTLCFMPAAQGAARWPRTGPSRTALVFDEELPLADSSIDRLLLVHALEFSENPRETLMELWRVLAPNGRLVLVVPNRRGVWARVEQTPFGNGRPFSRGQLVKLLRETNFTMTAETEALFFPPSRRFLSLRLSTRLEEWGLRLWPLFGGVLVVEAQKRLYQGLPVAERQSRRVFVPALAPQGTVAGRDHVQG